MKLVIRLGVALVGVVVLLVVGGVLVLEFSNGAAKQIVTRGVSYGVGVPVTAGDADIGLFGGTFEVSDLAIANPEGYGDDPFFALGSGAIKADVGSLMSDTIEVPTLSLDEVRVTLIKRGGESNYGVILDNLERFESEEAAEKPEPEEEPGTSVVVRELVITDVRAEVDYAAIGGDLTKVNVAVPEIRLTDVGGDEPLSIGDITTIVIKSVLATLVANGELPEQILGELAGGLKGLGDLTGSLAVDFGEGVQSLTGMGVGAIEDVGGGLKDAINSLPKLPGGG